MQTSCALLFSSLSDSYTAAFHHFCMFVFSSKRSWHSPARIRPAVLLVQQLDYS